MNNLNLMFNKTYYENLGKKSGKDLEADLNAKNEKLFRTAFDYDKDFAKNEICGPDETFRLMTTYPGMLIGTGNPHGTKEADADISVGFSFDYVTGQPYIPGSSVKGILRSYFGKDSKETSTDKAKKNAVIQILKGITGKDYSEKDIDKIREEIFDGNDVFFDAVVARGGRYNEVIGSDYITPHKEATKNPIPIHIAKILPDVVFEFRFKFAEECILDKKTKLELFKTILKLFGAGAKTNVGYGRLVEVTELEEQFNKPRPQKDADRNGNKSRYGDNKAKTKHQNSNKVEMVRCPHCNKMTFKYYKDSNKLRTRCHLCQESLN